MKKILLLVCILLCLSLSAFAAEMTYTGTVDAITVNTAGEHTVILNGVTIEATSSPAIDIQSPATKLTIVLKNGTTNTLTGGTQKRTYDNGSVAWDYYVGYAGIENNGVALVIRCENAKEGHECDDRCGKLVVTGKQSSAGIGGSTDQDMTGSVEIAGGNVTVTGGLDAPGIGTGQKDTVGYFESYPKMRGNVKISGGNVTVQGGRNSAGIGSVCFGEMSGSVTISGGTVTATGGERTIGDDIGGGAGIGAGEFGTMSGTITISGGKVIATGKKYMPGIGGSYKMPGDIIISGGEVEAYGGEYAAGIGAGMRGTVSGNIVISGGDVTAVSMDTVNSIGTVYKSPAVGCGVDGEITDTAKMVISPASGTIGVKAGETKESAVELEGSPYAVETDIGTLLNGDTAYANFRHIAPPATPAPEVPQTGDGMNAALTAVLMAMGMLGMTVILRKKNEA